MRATLSIAAATSRPSIGRYLRSEPPSSGPSGRLAHCRDAFAEARFFSLAEQERRAKDGQGRVVELLEACLELALHPVVEDAGALVGAERGHDEKAERAVRARDSRELERELVVDLAEGGLAARLLDRGAEAAEDVLARDRSSANRSGRSKSTSSTFESVRSRDRPPGEGRDASVLRRFEQPLEERLSDQAGGSGDQRLERGSCRARAKSPLARARSCPMLVARYVPSPDARSAAELLVEVVGDLVEADALLSARVAIAHGNALILRGLAVDGEAEGQPASSMRA